MSLTPEDQEPQNLPPDQETKPDVYKMFPPGDRLEIIMSLLLAIGITSQAAIIGFIYLQANHPELFTEPPTPIVRETATPQIDILNLHDVYNFEPVFNNPLRNSEAVLQEVLALLQDNETLEQITRSGNARYALASVLETSSNQPRLYIYPIVTQTGTPTKLPGLQEVPILSDSEEITLPRLFPAISNNGELIAVVAKSQTTDEGTSLSTFQIISRTGEVLFRSQPIVGTPEIAVQWRADGQQALFTIPTGDHLSTILYDVPTRRASELMHHAPGTIVFLSATKELVVAAQIIGQENTGTVFSISGQRGIRPEGIFTALSYVSLSGDALTRYRSESAE